ncbi:hypothetical protein RCL1_001669 [Eukaryota sp. TZLM3-RCL]
MHQTNIAIVLFLHVSLSLAQQWSSIHIINPTNQKKIRACSPARLLLENVKVDGKTTNDLTITLYSQNCTLLLSLEPTIQTISHGCCLRKRMHLPPVILQCVDSEFPSLQSESTLYIANLVHSKNIFHVFMDFLIPLDYTLKADNETRPFLYPKYCPQRHGLDSRYHSLLTPFTQKILTQKDLPMLFDKVYISLDYTSLTCKGHHLRASRSRRVCRLAIESFKNSLLTHYNLTHLHKKTMRPTIALLDRFPHNRQVLNLQPLSTMLKQNKDIEADVKVFRSNEMSLIEQIKFALSTDILVCVHGAGAIFQLFLKSPGAIIMFYPPSCVNYVYNNLADTLGQFHVNATVQEHERLYTRRDDRFLISQDVSLDHWKDTHIRLTYDRLLEHLKPIVETIHKSIYDLEFD